MEFLNKFKEHQQTARQKDIYQQAKNNIKLIDFDDKIYIAFSNTPLIPVEESWTQKDIINKLTELRKSYIDYEMRQISMPA